MAAYDMAEWEIAALRERLRAINAGEYTAAERAVFLPWLQATHGYHAMLRVKHRFANLGFDLYKTEYVNHLRDILAVHDAEVAARTNKFDGMPLGGPRPTA